MLSMDVLGKQGWSSLILDRHPQATPLKFRAADGLRMLNGVMWLLIITTLMMYRVNVLNMFLNFAALQFLQDVDDVAYKMAKNGYLTGS